MKPSIVLNIARMLHAAAATHGHLPAISLGDDPLADYRRFASRVRILAAGLRRLQGVAPGDRVAIVMTNCPQYLELLWAIWHAGLCAVPINAKLHAREIAFILGDTDASVCLVTGDVEHAVVSQRAELPALRHVINAQNASLETLATLDGIDPAETQEDAPAWIFYTSGTTGRPKGAVLTHRNLMAMALRYYGDIDAVDPGDTALVLAPMSHASGLMSVAHVGRAGHHVFPTSGGFDVDELFGLVRHHRNISFFAAPTMLMRIVNHPESAAVPWDRVKTLLYGGAPMYVADLLKAIERLGACLVQGYGQGETPITITVLGKAAHQERDHPEFEQRLASVGVPRLGVDVRVVDEHGKPAPPGQPGEVVVRSDVTMIGYWRNPEATAAALRDGWLYTGDVGEISAAGYLTLKDRSKDVIISGGSNIYPREVEEVLLRHPAVRECSVIGRQNADWGEDVVAVVVCQHRLPAMEAELDALCLDHIARFKRPKEYVFLEELPKSSYGKVLKSELRRIVIGQNYLPQSTVNISITEIQAI